MSETHIVPVRVQNVLDMEILKLNLWNIKFNANNIKLEGFVRSEDGAMMHRVCSEIICKRMTSTLLLDVSGRFFELSGQIDREFQLKNGMPGNIADEFSSGFPENWAFLINKCLMSEQITSRSLVSVTVSAPVAEQKQQHQPIVTMPDDTQLENEKTLRKPATESRIDEEPEEHEEYSFRVPRGRPDDATPIRWIRDKTICKTRAQTFADTPNRTKNSPLAGRQLEIEAAPCAASKNTQLVASTPKQLEIDAPPPTNDDGFLDQLDEILDNIDIVKTPAVIEPRRQMRERSRREECSRQYSPPHYNRSRYEERKMESRKRARRRSYSSDRDREFSSDEEYYQWKREQSRRDYERWRSGNESKGVRKSFDDTCRSVRFKDESRRRRQYEDEKLSRYEREEEDVLAQLEEIRRRRMAKKGGDSSGSLTPPPLEEKWDRDNRKLLENSMGVEEGKRGRRVEKKQEVAKAKKKAPVERKKAVRAPPPSDSLSANRPRRACATPVSATTQAVKKLTWPKRDLDKLRRVLEMRRPKDASSEKEWREVARLLAKQGAEWVDCKEAAVNRLKMRFEAVEEEEEKKKGDCVEEKEEEEKKRRGVAAAVKEDLKMREQMLKKRRSGRKDALDGSIESLEEIEPGDVSADESFLGAKPPMVAEGVRRRLGTRRTLVPEPVEDSPICKSSNSSLRKTPRSEAARMKEMENTMKYVQHLTVMQAKASSRAEKSYLLKMNGGQARRRNLNLTVEEGVERARRIISGQENDESMDSIMEEDDENTSNIF